MKRTYKDFLKTLKMSESRANYEYAVNNLIAIIKEVNKSAFQPLYKLYEKNEMECLEKNIEFLGDISVSEQNYTNKLLGNIMNNDFAKAQMKELYPDLFYLCELIPFQKKSLSLFLEHREYQEKIMTDIIKNNLISNISDLFRHHSSNEEIKFIGSGRHSCAFATNCHVIKLSEKKETYFLPTSDIWAQPIRREQIKNSVGEAFFTIEIQRELDLLNTIHWKYRTKIINYLQRKAIKAGWIWQDAKEENVGLLKEGDNNEITLPKGEGGFVEGFEERGEPLELSYQDHYLQSLIKRAKIIDLDCATTLDYREIVNPKQLEQQKTKVKKTHYF